jgi:gliding motility-associated lipoprotein GldH
MNPHLDFQKMPLYICKKNYLKPVAVYSFFAALLFFSPSCTNEGVFENNEEIPKHEWYYKQEPELSFTVTDTTSLYNVLVVLRHTDAYAYKNIWLFIATKTPGDSTFQRERFELNLQDQDGRWIGSGMNDTREIRYPVFENIRFTKTGTYTIRLQQTMRDNPLLHVMNAGIRIEKAKLK